MKKRIKIVLKNADSDDVILARYDMTYEEAMQLGQLAYDYNKKFNGEFKAIEVLDIHADEYIKIFS